MWFSRGGAQVGQAAQAGRNFMYNSGYMHSAPRMMMVGCGLLALIVIAVIIVVIVKKSHKRHFNSESMEALNVRYAKGELTDEEYTRMKNVLKNP